MSGSAGSGQCRLILGRHHPLFILPKGSDTPLLHVAKATQLYSSVKTHNTELKAPINAGIHFLWGVVCIRQLCPLDPRGDISVGKKCSFPAVGEEPS